MERSKITSAKKQFSRVKNTPIPVDFIALGKSGRADSDVKSSSSSQPSKNSLTSERKRELKSLTNNIAAKKSKLCSNYPLTVTKANDDYKGEVWETLAVEIETKEFVQYLFDENDFADEGKLERFLCGIIKQLKLQHVKLDSLLYLSLIYLVKTQPKRLLTDALLQGFCSLLKKDSSPKNKIPLSVPVLAANLLMFLHKEVQSWPEDFIRLYADDSIGDRVWVDSEECKCFVDNVVTAFNTKFPSRSLLQSEMFSLPKAEGCDPILNQNCPNDFSVADENSAVVLPRYVNMQDTIQSNLADMIREHLAKRQPLDNVNRNFLKFLIYSCGLSEIRLLAIQKLDVWLQNPKLNRLAHDLLLFVCLNCTTHSLIDVEIISCITKIRLKTKTAINHFLICLNELLNAHPDNLRTVLKIAVFNELSSNRNPNNMTIISTVLQASSSEAANILGQIYIELLLNKEDYLRALRLLLREIVKISRHDFPVKLFCLQLLQEPEENLLEGCDYKERIFLSIADIVTLGMLLAVSPAIKEVSLALSRGDKKDIEILREFQMLIATIQRDVIWWFHTIAVKLYKPTMKEFAHCIHKILFMEQTEHYYLKDNWPPESERHLLLHLVSEVPVLQDTLLRIMVIGLSKEHPLNAPDALELGDQLIKRAASIYSEDFAVLEMDKMQLIDVIFNLTIYHHPENIALPPGYVPPKLAITNLYWKAWIMLLIITAHNPTVFGAIAWEGYPTLRALMEMCITNHFVFPPPSYAAGEKAEELCQKESQLSNLEKNQILEFETYLAAASTKITITESNSLLLSQLTSMDFASIARKPSLTVLEQVKVLNSNLKLGTLLCKSRNPDFLLNILQRQGPAQAMPWLADLVESNESAVHLLPIQCLCEFILNDNVDYSGYDSEYESSKEGRTKKKCFQKKEQLLRYMQEMIHSSETDPQSVSEILEYFLQRLSSQHSSSRQQAILGLNNLFCLYKEDFDSFSKEKPQQDRDMLSKETWLDFIPHIPHFNAIHGSLIAALRQACQVENDVTIIASYIHFISLFTVNDSLQQMFDLTLDMAQLIVERNTVISFLLPEKQKNQSEIAHRTLQDLLCIFLWYMEKAREPDKESFSWSECQDQIIVQWSSGETATMHILVVHAIIILLCYGSRNEDRSFTELLEIWFPSHGQPPVAYLIDTSEEALLFPDWLKLRMIRSSVPALVKVALKDLETPQLLLFIQSFGIPVENMNQLLFALDNAVSLNPDAINVSVMDKSYMAHLVEVQHMRGAVGGHKFMQSLGIRIDSPDTEEHIIPNPSSNFVVLKKENPKVIMDNVSAILKQIFVEKSYLHDYTSYQNFKNIQKELLKDKSFSYVCTILRSVINILKGPDANSFINGMHENHIIASSFFHILISVECNSPNAVKELFSEFLKLIKDSPSKMTSPSSILIQTLFNKKITKKIKKKNWLSNSTFEIKNFLQFTNIFSLEFALKELIQSVFGCQDIEKVILSITEIILKKDSSKENKSIFSNAILFDWLELLDPELIHSCSDNELQLIFSKETIDKSKTLQMSSQSHQLYFLSLLIHNCSWLTLQKCIKLILCDWKPIFDSTSVLDFLSACMYIPKLWKGRDKHIPKHYMPENMLILHHYEILNLIKYILEEADNCETTSNASITIKNRIPLILKCCTNPKVLCSIVLHLSDTASTSNEKHQRLCCLLLCQLYIKVPSVINDFSDNIVTYLFKEIKVQTFTDMSSIFDIFSHNLLTALSVTESGKDCLMRMQDYELAFRKLAATHPVFILRQLPLLANLLHGRVYLEFSIFKEQNHMMLFIIVIGIVELLQPTICFDHYKNSFEDLLESYFMFFKFHGRSQEMQVGSLLNKFVSLLNNYANISQTNAIKLIQTNLQLLHDMFRYHPDCFLLRTLIQNLSIAQAVPSTRFMSDKENHEISSPLFRQVPRFQMIAGLSKSELTPLITRLHVSNTAEEIQSVLQDVDYISMKHAEVLECFEVG